MKNKYQDLIEQTFDFPQEEFRIENNALHFHDINMGELIDKFGTPLRFTYIPKVGSQIDKCRSWFNKSIEDLDYKGKYHYCYCTKSSHFKFIIEECLAHGSHIETSSAFDIDIVLSLFRDGKLNPDSYILCNGFKTERYVEKIKELLDEGFTNIIPIIDNFMEFEYLDKMIDVPMEIGIRIASEEDPKFEFYTSRLGIGYKDIPSFYKWKIKGHPKFKLSLMHFFVNTGIRDNAYYWNELRKFLHVYTDLIKLGADISFLDIGGGFPVKNSLAFEFDYEYLIEEIISQIKSAADSQRAPHPDLFTEFGSFTVSEAGGVVFTILHQKKQNDKERWNMINGSFMTTLPDTWAINKRFIMLPINRWEDKYERVFLGGLTCDSDDYYNSEQHINAIYLPEFKADKPLHVGFFNCGAYQESISGYGGIKHCLIPSPKHVIINEDENGEKTYVVYSEEQRSEHMLNLLGYK